jgi:hypothetical protein
MSSIRDNRFKMVGFRGFNETAEALSNFQHHFFPPKKGNFQNKTIFLKIWLHSVNEIAEVDPAVSIRPRKRIPRFQ